MEAFSKPLGELHQQPEETQNVAEAPTALCVINTFAAVVLQESWIILTSANRLRYVTLETVNAILKVAAQDGTNTQATMCFNLFTRILKITKYCLFYTMKNKVQNYLEHKKAEFLKLDKKTRGNLSDYVKKIDVDALSPNVDSKLPPQKKQEGSK
jgi:hypothetical protein